MEGKERVPFREQLTFEELGKTPEEQITKLWLRDNEATRLINLLKYKIEDLQQIVVDLKSKQLKVPFGGEID